MNTSPAIDIQNLVYRYDSRDAVQGLSLRVQPGECYGFFGRNGAGKTTTIKCLLNLLRPQSGKLEVFGMDPARQEAAVKSCLAYVPDFVAFYPWMTVRGALDYQASFRKHWNRDLERELLERFQLDEKAPTSGLSKGQRTQLALVGAISPEPELLVLDEPTSGLDPLVRREFIQTVIGAYQDAAPGKRTVFVSTHLISEFEGLIDRFTIINRGRELLTSNADEARTKFRRLRAEFEGDPPPKSVFRTAKSYRSEGRSLELIVNGDGEAVQNELKSRRATRIEAESLTLEEIFMAVALAETTEAP
jgi:ABC-2 type transport system ATP-binding protein